MKEGRWESANASGRKGEVHGSGSAEWEKEGEPLHAAYDPSPEYSPERCQNGMDHNVFGFREGIAQAHGIRRSVER